MKAPEETRPRTAPTSAPDMTAAASRAADRRRTGTGFRSDAPSAIGPELPFEAGHLGSSLGSTTTLVLAAVIRAVPGLFFVLHIRIPLPMARFSATARSISARAVRCRRCRNASSRPVSHSQARYSRHNEPTAVREGDGGRDLKRTGNADPLQVAPDAVSARVASDLGVGKGFIETRLDNRKCPLISPLASFRRHLRHSAVSNRQSQGHSRQD